jgi:hypothetical protein
VCPDEVKGLARADAPREVPGVVDAQEVEVGRRGAAHALGAVLYRLLTGRPPYEAESPARGVERAAACDFPSVDALAREAPSPLREICKKAMAARPEERYPTAQHFADALEGFSSNAVSRAYQRSADRTAWVALAFGLVASLGGVAGITRLAEGLLFGPQIFIGLTSEMSMKSLALLELRAGGRLGIAPLGYGMAGCTFLSGFIALGSSVLTRTDPLVAARTGAAVLAINALFTAVTLGAWGAVLFKRSS